MLRREYDNLWRAASQRRGSKCIDAGGLISRRSESSADSNPCVHRKKSFQLPSCIAGDADNRHRSRIIMHTSAFLYMESFSNATNKAWGNRPKSFKEAAKRCTNWSLAGGPDANFAAVAM